MCGWSTGLCTDVPYYVELLNTIGRKLKRHSKLNNIFILYVRAFASVGDFMFIHIKNHITCQKFNITTCVTKVRMHHPKARLTTVDRPTLN